MASCFPLQLIFLPAAFLYQRSTSDGAKRTSANNLDVTFSPPYWTPLQPWLCLDILCMNNDFHLLHFFLKIQYVTYGHALILVLPSPWSPCKGAKHFFPAMWKYVISGNTDLSCCMHRETGRAASIFVPFNVNTLYSYLCCLVPC